MNYGYAYFLRKLLVQIILNSCIPIMDIINSMRSIPKAL